MEKEEMRKREDENKRALNQQIQEIKDDTHKKLA
jgi:hypothetical protein